MSELRTDLSRPVLIHCCKDRTLSYRTREQPIFNGVALPVFSVDTPEQAENMITILGSKQYEDHPQMPGRPWMKVTVDFKQYLDTDDLPKVTAKCRQVWEIMQRAGNQ